MISISINGENGDFLKIDTQKIYGYPDTTCPFGGYDTQSSIEIKVSSYNVKGLIWISTGDLYFFYKKLKKCYINLEGESELKSYENNLISTLKFDEYGKIAFTGKFTEKHDGNNTLEFEIISDQSYIKSTISQLEQMIESYGDNTGVKKATDNTVYKT